MSVDQDEVARLIRRTRASREKLNRHLNDFEESPRPTRNPLREKNVKTTTTTTTSSTDAPTKVVRSSTFTKRPSSPLSSDSRRSSVRLRNLGQSPSSSMFVGTENSFDDIPKNSSKETYNREVTERKTTIEDSPVREGSRERYTTTTITEKEETIRKTEHFNFTEIVPMRVATSSDRRSAIRDRMNKVTTRFLSGEDKEDDDDNYATKRKGTTTLLSSPTRSPSSKRTSTIVPVKKASSAAIPIVTSHLRTCDYDEDVFGASGRKKRLAELTKKFQDSSEDDEEDEELAAIDKNRRNAHSDLNVTKEINVDENEHRPEPKSECWTPRRNNFREPRSQNFEETAPAIKAKLVHDVRRPTILSSPTKNATEPRPSSPHKPHPMQFISPAYGMGSGMAFGTVQFPRSGPIAKSWTRQDEQMTAAGSSSKTPKPSTTIHPVSEPRTDAASSKSMAEKLSLFEGQRTDSSSDSDLDVDPAMLSMSERRALFEKNKWAPKPVARFGNAVTPSMLLRGQNHFEVSSEPKKPLTRSQQQRSSSRMKSPSSPPLPTKRSLSPPKDSPKKDSWQQGAFHSRREYDNGEKAYPGVDSLKRIKVSPPRPGCIYPQLVDSSDSAEMDDMLDDSFDSFGSNQYHLQREPMSSKATRIGGSPTSTAGKLPAVEGEDDANLLHTVSFYRKQTANSTPVQKIVRKAEAITEEPQTRTPFEAIQQEISKLHDEEGAQLQHMGQASKALNFCISQNGFEGSAERVEGERLLLESTHKYMAATAEIRRLSTEGAMGRADGSSSSKGSIAISGLRLPLKGDFVRMLRAGGDDTVHHFIVLVKYRGLVLATQMMSTMDGINRGKLVFPNVINLKDLDFDFQILVEVYGLQTRKEHIPHDVKYHIRKEKPSGFNLTPLKKHKKQDSSPFRRNQNPVNSKTIRRPAFGMVGSAIINIHTLKNRAFQLDRLPQVSPLEGGLEMTLTIHSESRLDQRGFLTMFTDVNGYGDWCRRWCRLSGNALQFWKYPEDETKMKPSEQILLSICVTGDVSLAPRDICSRMNTFMLETRRPWRQGDGNSLVMHVNRQTGVTTLLHLLSADTREERHGWCSILSRTLENIRAWDPNAFRAKDENLRGCKSSFDAISTVSSGAVSSTSTDIW